MTDPLSATLAVITLATMVKDLVELGQKIQESFAKVSNNLRSAQRVAEDIKRMLDEIEVFYKDHKDALDNMKDFKVALQALLGKFRSFETSILPLLPRTGGRRRDRLIRGWDAWRKSNKTEECILDLKSDIVNVKERYMMQSAMRTEVKLETIHQETSRGLTGISQGLETLDVVRRDISALCLSTAAITTIRRPYEPSGLSSDDFNQNVIMFATSTPSTSAPMLRTPSMITEELMAIAYIRLQINHIVTTLETISMLPATIPDSVNNFLMTVSVQKSMSITRLRRQVVRQTIDICDLLDTESMQTVSIQDGARALNNLSVNLAELDMRHESIQVGAWAITLARTLVDTSSDPHPDLCAAFALYLSNQSIQYYKNGDKTQSIQASEKAYTIAQNLRNQYNGEVRFQILYSEVLLQYAQLVNIQRSIELLVEAVEALEDILNVHAFTRSQSPIIDSVLPPSPSFLDNLFSQSSDSALPITPISRYALALQRLGVYLFKAGHPESAVDLELLAIAVLQRIVFVYGDEYKADLASALSLLVRGENARSRIPAERLVDMAEQCIQLLQELAENNPLYYSLQLINVLWTKAKTLEALGRDAAAIATWNKVVSLAEQFLEDSRVCGAARANLSNHFRRLKMHDKAAEMMQVITVYQDKPEIQASRYTQLSMDLGQLRRYKESAEAARTAVALNRHAAMMDPGTWSSVLTLGLSHLARCLAASGDCSEAMIAWKESVQMLENFLSKNPDASSSVNDDYIGALHTHILIGYALEDEGDILEVSSTAARYFRQLSDMCCPQNLDAFVNLLYGEFCHAYDMLRVGRLQDGLRYIDQWLDVTWRVKLEVTSDSEMMRWHATMMALKSNMLDAQGRTGEALLATQKVHDIVRPSVSTHQPSFAEMIKSMVHKARLQINLDDSNKALKVAEEALQLSLENSKLDPAGRRPVRSLHGVASTALYCRNYKRAVDVAKEGCDICASEAWHDGEGEYNVLLRPSLFAILSSAEANLGRYSTAVEYAHRAVHESLEIRKNKLEISITTAEDSYMETRGNLAEILLVTGDLAQARQICEERSAYFSKRVETRMGDYREWAPVLRMLGVLCCSEGRHEEGEAAAQELSRIIETLGSVFPSLLGQVRTRLRHQASIPILTVLADMGEKLDCGHQAGVLSLFAN